MGHAIVTDGDGRAATLDAMLRRIDDEASTIAREMEATRGEARARVRRASRALPLGFRHFSLDALYADGSRFLEVRWTAIEDAHDRAIVRTVVVEDGRAIADGRDVGPATPEDVALALAGVGFRGAWTAPLQTTHGFTSSVGFVLPVSGPLVDRHPALARLARLAPEVGTDADGAARRYGDLATRLRRLRTERMVVDVGGRQADRGNEEATPGIEARPVSDAIRLAA